MSNPNALYLLADHVKLSLLERKRAQALNLDSDSQDGHISRSLDQFREGLESLGKEKTRLEEAGDDAKASNIASALSDLEHQFADLTSQFHGFSSPATNSTLTHPNDPSLAEDFEHASTVPAVGASKKSPNSKTVRFSDGPDAASAGAGPAPTGSDVDLEAARTGLFGRHSLPYRDDPSSDDPTYRDQVEGAAMDNVQIHAFHRQVIEEQDAQLDALGASISRQRELSMQIGDELDSQVAMLDESERLIDRQAGTLTRARRSVGRISRAAGESKQMVIIVVLIVILVLLIAILK